MKYDIGMTFGVFDLFHVGHLNLLEKCKENCNRFIVAICDDDYVRNIKHKEPVFKQDERLRIVGALKCVDQVILVNSEETLDKTKVFPRIGGQFNVLFSGDDWKGSDRFRSVQEQFNKLGIDICWFPYTQGISSSQIRSSLTQK